MADDHLPIKANHLPEMECNDDKSSHKFVKPSMSRYYNFFIFRTAQMCVYVLHVTAWFILQNNIVLLHFMK